MGIKSLFFGLQRSDVEGKSTLEAAVLSSRQLQRSLGVAALLAILLCLGYGSWALWTHSSADAAVPYAALIFAGLIVIAVYAAANMPLFQMRQIEDQRLDTLRLTQAIEELTKELRRRPQTASTLSFSIWSEAGHGR
jgi:hypothetical protein